MEEENTNKINEFFAQHSGIVTFLGLLMIFLGTTSDKILPPIEDKIDFSSGSTFIWLGAIILILICLYILTKDSLLSKYISVKILAGLFILLLLPLLIYLALSVMINNSIIEATKNIPSSLLITLLVFMSPIAITVLDKVMVKCKFPFILEIIIHSGVFLFSLIFIIYKMFSNTHEFSTSLISLKISYWVLLSIIISYVFTILNLSKRRYSTQEISI